MASGAGVNRLGVLGGIPLLSMDANASAVSTPLADYGIIGVNDSGPQLWWGAGYTKWTVQLIGDGAQAAGYTVSFYGTCDPVLLKHLYGGESQAGPQYYTSPPGDYDIADLADIVPASSWSLLPMQASTGGGTETNPLVSGTNTIGFVNGGIVAIRAVLTATNSPSDPCTALAFVMP